MAGDTSNGAADRRRHPRFNVERGAIVELTQGGLKREGVIVDLSLGGLRIRLTESAPRIEGVFTISNDTAGELQGRQSWVMGSAMGVEFDMPEDSKLARELRCVQLLIDEEAKQGESLPA